MKLLRLELKAAALDLSRELAYKGNFIMKSLAMVISDFIGPMLTLLLYSTTLGIPGWSFYEFLLFQGTFTIVVALGHTFVLSLPYATMYAVDRGEFDKFLVLPFSPLLYMITQSIMVEGFVELLSGMLIVGFAMWSLGLSVFSASFAGYVLLVLLGLLFQVGIMVLVSALAFVVVKSDALMLLYFKLSDFARWPLSIYGPLLKMFLVFLFPVAVSSFFPAELLLRGLEPMVLVQAVVPVLVFLSLAVLCWQWALRRYASAGG